MKYIISGTNRPGSRSLEVSKIVQKIYAETLKEQVEILDLGKLPMNLVDGTQYASNKPAPVRPELVQQWIDKVNLADGLIIVAPEYNGSFPGILKYFIDLWPYPETFEYRPVCFIGLGGRFGGLRPIEHLQQVFGYRNAFVFPERVFLINIWKILTDGTLQDAMAMELLVKQAETFSKFITGIKSQSLDANSINKSRPPKK